VIKEHYQQARTLIPSELRIKEITQKEIWEDFLLGCKEKTFLDSWNWGEFQKKMGEKIWRLGVFESLTSGVKPLIIALVIKIKAKRGSFLFVPHGPVIKNGRGRVSSIFEILLEELKEIAKKENCSFIRIAPIWERNQENIKIFQDLGFRQAPIHMHPEITWELALIPSEEELLMNMRKTTRYLIRQAQKNKALEIIQSNKIESLEKFNQLYQETKDRHHFVPFSLDYLKNEFLSFVPDNQPVRQAQGYPECIEGQISILLGKYKNEIVSSAMIIFWQGIGFYHQGASSQKYSKVPVSYLLQWEAIREAKKRGCKTYNFWGIADTKYKIQDTRYKKHSWYGLTLFKMGFGGYKKEYVKTQDLVLSSKYWLTYIIERLRKMKRGL